MASLREISRSMRRLNVSSQLSSRPGAPIQCQRRFAVTQAEGAAAPAETSELSELETETTATSFVPNRRGNYENPKIRALRRKMNLPASRYQYHPPKYNRGPLHPIQSPVASDPISRNFVPGPFNLPRLRQTWQSTVASDLMTLAYIHRPPGVKERVYGERLRTWDDSSPYHKNRPLRQPRGGGSTLRPIEHHITFNNIPEIVSITVSSFQPKCHVNPHILIATRAAVQAITGAVPEIIKIKRSVASFKLIKGRKAGVKVTIYGNEAYEFFDKMVNLVFPRIKDWPGVRGTTGDDTGNLAFGLKPDHMLLFPEIEVNQSQYPPDQMPGMRVFVKTTAESDRHARLLFQAMGVPFYGKVRN